jgi:hypothetical protein
MSNEYEELAAMAERGELKVKPGTVKRGAASRAAAQAAFMNATGAESLDEAMTLGLGRPPVGSERGPSPQVRARVTPGTKRQVRWIAAQQHRSESDIVRDALAAYVAKSHPVP